MSAIDSQGARRCLTALRVIRELRSRIASELAIAAVNVGSDIDMAGDIENLRSWLDDGAAPLQDALKGADHMLCAAADDEYERMSVLHPAAAE
jgi:hypothetical protein